MTRAAPELHRAALKTSVRQLVSGLGGFDAAASTTRVVRSKLHSYGDIHAPDRHMPIDIVLDLETCLGDPLVTRELARLSGHLLLPMEFGEGDAAKALSAVAQNCGKTLADALHALADDMPPEEVAVVLADLSALSSAVSAAIAVLRGPKKT